MSEEYLYAATQPTSQQEPISLVVVSQAGCSWATLKSKLGKFDYNNIVAEYIIIGREPKHKSEKNDNSTLLVQITEDQIQDQKVLERISRTHFTITKQFSVEISADEKTLLHAPCPGILEVKGINGIEINNHKLLPNEKQVLIHEDIISFHNVQLFQFCYDPSYIADIPDISSKYFLGQKISEGTFGQVHVAWNIKSCKKCALKAMTVNNDRQRQLAEMGGSANILTIEDIEAEFSLMKSLSHMHVIQAFDSFLDKQRGCIIMELMTGGRLTERISSKNRDSHLTEPVSNFFFWQLVEGLGYLHSYSITHRDLKPDNVLLKTRDEITLLKIADFGTATRQSEMNKQCGTEKFKAPEMSACKQYSNKVDIWALGGILYWMLTGSSPFNDHGKIKENIFSSYKWEAHMPQVKKLLSNMLQVEPSKRFSIREVSEDSWLIYGCHKYDILKVIKKYSSD